MLLKLVFSDPRDLPDFSNDFRKCFRHLDLLHSSFQMPGFLPQFMEQIGELDSNHCASITFERPFFLEQVRRIFDTDSNVG